MAKGLRSKSVRKNKANRRTTIYAPVEKDRTARLAKRQIGLHVKSDDSKPFSFAQLMLQDTNISAETEMVDSIPEVVEDVAMQESQIPEKLSLRRSNKRKSKKKSKSVSYKTRTTF